MALCGDGSFCPAVVENARRWLFRNAHQIRFSLVFQDLELCLSR